MFPGYLLHSDHLLRSLAHWKSPKVALPQKCSGPNSIIQRKRVREGVRGNLPKISQRWIWKGGPESSKHSPLPHSTWPLVPSRSCWPLADLNPRGHSPHTGGWRGFGCGLGGHEPDPGTPHKPTQALQASNSTGSDTQQVTPPPLAPSRHLSPGHLLSSASFLTPYFRPFNKCLLRALLTGLSTGMQR